MVTLVDLWLPILGSAVAVFFISFTMWMVLPHHKGDWKPLPDEDGTMDTTDGEQVLIRHSGNRIEWRVNGDPSTSFDILGVWVTNDHDGDGTTDPMFLPDVTPNPKRVTVTITTEAPALDPQTRRPIRYTVSSDVVFRKEL